MSNTILDQVYKLSAKERRKEEELRWWREVYLAALQGGNIPDVVREIADAGVIDLKERSHILDEEDSDEG